MPIDDEPRWQQQTAPRSQRGKVPAAEAATAPTEVSAAPTPGEAPERAARRVPGWFVVGEELGRGGMGCVVAATDTVLERAVAIKQALADDADSLRRFERYGQRRHASRHLRARGDDLVRIQRSELGEHAMAAALLPVEYAQAVFEL